MAPWSVAPVADVVNGASPRTAVATAYEMVPCRPTRLVSSARASAYDAVRVSASCYILAGPSGPPATRKAECRNRGWFLSSAQWSIVYDTRPGAPW